ncbi:MAG TPA: hypothetical protein PLC99_13260 [Verrucomicrobiota bacterium]|nr:hypothetical protein [Verrucomicrobiota bacterium]
MIRTKSKIKALAFALDANEAWVGALLTKLRVEVDPLGDFDSKAVRVALEQMIRTQPDSSLPNQVFAEMGPSEESCRQWLIEQFRQHGLQLEGRAFRNGARMTLKRQDGSTLRVMTYVALKARASGQVGFSVNRLDDEGLDWVALVAKPFGKVYLRRRREILESFRGEIGRTACLTFSAGSDANLLQYRIRELNPDVVETGT